LSSRSAPLGWQGARRPARSIRSVERILNIFGVLTAVTASLYKRRAERVE
jgi:hypothetical protein